MLLKASKTLLYISVLCVLVVMTSTFFPFIGGKYYFFRFAVELSLIFLFLWWAFEAKQGELGDKFKHVYKKPLFIAVSLFVLAFLLASVFANDPHAAFWSNFERGEGGFQMLHYYAFFVLSILILEKKDWEILFGVSLGTAVLMIVYGVFAQFGVVKTFIGPYAGGQPPVGLWHQLTDARFEGSLGNPAYVAPYLLFSIFYAAYFWFSKKIKNAWTNGCLFGGLIVFFLFFFLLSQTRGTLLGLGASVFVFLLYAAFSIKKVRKQIIGSLIGVALTGGLLVHFSNSTFVKDIPGSRIFDISFSQDTLSTRIWTWGSAWQGFKERPILGWGPENFSTVFDKYFDIRHYTPGTNSETWFDRAHSVVFDYLAEAGILGFAGYISMFVVLYWEMAKTFKKEERSSTGAVGPALTRAAMLGLPLGYLVQGLVLFDVLPIYMNLFLFLGFAFYYFYSAPHHQATHAISEEAKRPQPEGHHSSGVHHAHIKNNHG